MVLAALPFGVGLYGWTWTYFVTATLLLFTVWSGMQTYLAARLPGALHDYHRILQFAAAFLGFLAFTVVPIWPAGLVGVLSPGAGAIYEFADVGMPRTGYAFSLDAGLAMRNVPRVAAYFALFFLVLVLVRTRRQAMLLANLLLLAVFVVGLWGLVEFLWLQHGRGRAAGLFGNANYFAGFLELGLGLTAGMLFARQDRAGHSAWRSRLVVLIDWVMSWRANLVLVFVVMLGGLFASGSRGGTLAFVAALLVAVVLLVRGRESSPHLRRFVVSLVMICVTSVAWLGMDALWSRIESGNHDQAARFSYWASGLRMVEDFPLFGIGGGSWRYAYAMYRDPQLPANSLPLHAHNDHIQMLAEHGLIGYLLMGLFIGSVLLVLASALRNRRDRFVRGIVFGSLVSSLALLFHAFTDSNFQVTPTTAYFFAILGLGLAVARFRNA